MMPLTQGTSQEMWSCIQYKAPFTARNELSGSALLRGVAVLNFVITPLYGVMPVTGADAVGYGCSFTDMSGALSSCCGEYRSVSADSRSAVTIKTVNSVHTSLISV